LKPSGRGEYEITDAIQGLVDSGAKVEHYALEGWWIDAGNPDDMIEANRLVLQDLQSQKDGFVDDESDLRGNIHVGRGSEIRRSTIRGPVIIGENCIIENAYIGNFCAIGSNSKICDCEIEHSVIMEDCEVRNIRERIDFSIFGRNVTVMGKEKRPKAYKLVLSDKSAVELP
jgi:glucose-1-phosphate thymidylyltransferase